MRALVAAALAASFARGFVASPPKRTATSANLFDMVRQNLEDVADLIEQKKQEDIQTMMQFQTGLGKSRDQFLSSVLGLKNTDELEEALLLADLGYDATEAILADVKRYGTEKELKSIIRNRLLKILDDGGDRALKVAEEGPTVISVIGSNGMGKTTTIGKLANRLKLADKKVLVAACDTFRAAAVDQLAQWTERAEVDLFEGTPGTTQPSAVAFQAMDKALREDYDVVLVDTSGRLSNNQALTEELKKIQRTLTKKIPAAPHETLLVVDAAVGRNAIDQARTWKEQCGVTGVVVTKLDGTSRAGFCVSVVQDLQLPVKLVGLGEQIADLKDFDPSAFVDSLLDVDSKQKKMFESDRLYFNKPPPPQKRAEVPASSVVEDDGEDDFGGGGGEEVTRRRVKPNSNKKKKKKKRKR